MNLLLDTHVFIWFINGDKQLSAAAKKRIENRMNKSFISIASIWEIAIKIRLGKLQLNASFDKVRDKIRDNGFELLPISFEHTALLTILPMHHRDPFDRMIIAQAIIEKMTILSKDGNFKKYRVKLIGA